MTKLIGTPLEKSLKLDVIENDPNNPQPGFGWTPSQECLDRIKAIEENRVLAMRTAPFIFVD